MDSKNTQEHLENIYLTKIKNIVSIAIHGLFENIVYIYENKDTFDDINEFDTIIKKYVTLLNYTATATNEELDELILLCVQDRAIYKQKALDGLHGSYNLDYNTDIFELVEKSKGLLDETHLIEQNDIITKDYLLSLVNEKIGLIDAFDNYTLSSICALSAIIENNTFEKILSDNISKIPDELIQTFLNNSKIKAKSITKTYKLKEFKNAPLTVFDYYSCLFSIQNQMIVCLTFFEEIRTLFNDNIIIKDNFFTFKKVLVDNDVAFLESIVEKNEVLLDDLIEANDEINLKIETLSETSDNLKSNYLHKYVDFLEELLFEDIHYFMQSVDNATMGINIGEEVLTTLDNLEEPINDTNSTFNSYYKFIYKNANKLDFSNKLIYYKALTSLIFSQLTYIGYLNQVTINTDELLDSIKNSYDKLTLNEVKLLTAFLID